MQHKEPLRAEHHPAGSMLQDSIDTANWLTTEPEPIYYVTLANQGLNVSSVRPFDGKWLHRGTKKSCDAYRCMFFSNAHDSRMNRFALHVQAGVFLIVAMLIAFGLK